MKNYIIRRLLQLIPVLLGISIAIFAVLRLIPGGFASGMLGIDATPELIEQVNARYGLDQPAITQYFNWIGGVLRGDFGQSFRSGAEILPEILTRFQVTAELTILAAIISWVIALPLGILAAVKRNKLVDRVVRVVALLGVSVPGFALSILIILVLSLAFNYYPPLNYVGLFEDPLRNLEIMFLPVSYTHLGRVFADHDAVIADALLFHIVAPLPGGAGDGEGRSGPGELQAHVQRPHAVGERADADEVDAGFGHGAQLLSLIHISPWSAT